MKAKAHNRGKNYNASAGFTLLEILVVLTILSVLTAISVSVFSHIRENGRRIACQNNIKQMALAMQQYVQDTGGLYPGTSTSWQQAIKPYVSGSPFFVCPTQNPATHRPDGIYYAFNVRRLADFTSRFSSSQHFLTGVSEGSVINPTTVWLNSDEDEEYRTEILSSCGRKFNGVTIHSGGANYSFVDGHIKWLTPKSIGEVDCLNPPLSSSRSALIHD